MTKGRRGKEQWADGQEIKDEGQRTETGEKSKGGQWSKARSEKKSVSKNASFCSSSPPLSLHPCVWNFKKSPRFFDTTNDSTVIYQ